MKISCTLQNLKMNVTVGVRSHKALLQNKKPKRKVAKNAGKKLDVANGMMDVQS